MKSLTNRQENTINNTFTGIETALVDMFNMGGEYGNEDMPEEVIEMATKISKIIEDFKLSMER